MDRPSRKTTVVSYSEAKDFDDDEDFACVKAPPSKKAREENKNKKSSSKSSSQESKSQSTLSQKTRPLDVKLYERDLEAAITLSLLKNEDGIKDQSPTSKGDLKVQVPVVENTDPTSLHMSNCSVDLAVLGLDEITSEKEPPALSRQRKVATKGTEEKRFTDEDEDYEPKLTPESESDEDFSEPSESEDEEFTVKKVSKTKKKDRVTKNEKTKTPCVSKKEKQLSKPSTSKSQATAASTPVRSPPTVKLATKRPASSSTVSTSKPALSLSPAGGRIPKWNPPAQVGGSPPSSSPAVKSPGQGLRLGLSRLVRVKPLHPSVASH
ncbi:RAD51-associated protein 1 isoform X3 [Etheostoma spectabile]|uniref:RAD51-associated protein 1 isoform X3 n=1 Tax=Etheostoma spectabile TaxID=54343 RepID=UPI0013AE9CD9|nr:RAD51-associated protein 1 isoform X3 [Etheostoma spectabile]